MFYDVTDVVRTTDLSCRKRPLYQNSHHHWPTNQFLRETNQANFFCKFLVIPEIPVSCKKTVCISNLQSLSRNEMEGTDLVS